MSALTTWLDDGHFFEQFSVKLLSPKAKVHPTVAGWTERNYQPWMVWSAVCTTVKMVGLKIRRAICPGEWCWVFAALTNTLCAVQDVIAYVTRAVINGAFHPAFRPVNLPSDESSTAKLRQVDLPGGRDDLVRRLRELLNGDQFEHNGLTHGARSIGRGFAVPTLTNHLAMEEQVSVRLNAEQKQVFSIDGVPIDGFVAEGYLHVAYLASTEVLDETAGMEAVAIAVLFAWPLPRRQK